MKIFTLFLFLISTYAFSNQVEVIELHENKSLDQMVIEKIENENTEISVENIEADQLSNTSISEDQTSTKNENLINIEDNFNNDLDISILNYILNSLDRVTSKSLQNEFNNFLINLNLDYEIKENRDVFFNIVNYFYRIGSLSKATLLIKSRDLENDENLSFYNMVQINYLLSTFKLDEVCTFKDQILLEINDENNFKDKIEIFCLVLEDKKLEAQLLNSIMIETETRNDEIFQELFTILSETNNEKNYNYEFPDYLNPQLIFLYSAMARIAELPLNENFLNIDPLNMSIPIILNKLTNIDLRIKAANQSYLNQTISIDSLAALYLSVDFNSSQINNSEQTIEVLSNETEILMAYYFQLINVQIFPSERLQALINFWNFAKQNNLEKIAYSLSFKFIDSIEISSDYLDYASQIATAYIYNKNFVRAIDWLSFYENAKGIDDTSTFVRILLNLYSSDDIDSIVQTITTNFDKLTDPENQNNQELIEVLQYVTKE